MKKKIHSPKIFFGWWIVFVVGMVSGLGHGFYLYAISVFFKDLAAELHLSRAVTSVAAGIGRLEGGITSPLVGWLADRHGPKWVIFIGVCVAGFGFILMNFINSMWTYFVVWGLVVGVGLNIGLTVAVDKALNDWFVNKRGLAQGIKFSLIGVGGMLLLPIVTWLVASQGWRITCLLWGFIMLASAPILLMVVKQKRPEHYGLLPDGAKFESDEGEDTENMMDRGVRYAISFQETEFTFKQAIKTRAYWILGITFGVQMMISGGLVIHVIPFLTDMGIPQTTAGNMMGMMVFFTVLSRFFSGLISDRLDKDHMQFLLAGIFLLQSIGITIFLVSRNTISVYIFLALFGFSSGASTLLFIITQGRFFGRKAFGSIFGSSMAIRAPASLIAPVFSGWVYDTTGSYMGAFILFAIFSTLAAFFICWARPPRLYQ
jgi:MFS family permease